MFSKMRVHVYSLWQQTLCAACVVMCMYTANGALPYIIDQAAHTISTEDAFGFSAQRLAGYGVRQVAAGSIDCTSYLDSVEGGPWYNASERAYIAGTIANTAGMIAVGKGAGMEVYMSSDIFQLPIRMLDALGPNFTVPGTTCIGYRKGPVCISIASDFTRSVYRALFDELIHTFPTIDGLILRYGENSPCAFHKGNAPYDSTSLDTMVDSLQALLLFLREELCVNRNLTVVFRTWDTSTQYFHANATFYQQVLDAVPPHPKLVIAVKHTMLDFWRRVRFNPTLGVGSHQQVVEAEVGGMYGGCGSWPLYIGNGVINHYSEDEDIDLPHGLTWLLQQYPSIFAGILTNHQCTSTPMVNDPWPWWRLETAVMAGWAASSGLEEEESVFMRVAEGQLGLSDPAQRALFRNLTLTAMNANLAIQTCAVFDMQLQEVDRPTANWMQWDGWGGLEQLANDTCNAYNASHCRVMPWLVSNGQLLAALEEKAWAAETYRALNETAFNDVAPGIPNTTLASAILASVEAGVFASGIVSAGWAAMGYGYEGDVNGGMYNTSAIRRAIAEYDALWEGYRGLSARWGSVAPGLMNDSYWQHPSSGQPGMRQSVDKYRHL